MSEPPADERSGLVADIISFSNVDGPGNRFAIFLQGCNFDCIACHNPQTIPGHGPVEGHHPTRMTVGEVLVQVRRAAPFVRGVTVSGGEATQQAHFVHDLFAALRADPGLDHLTTLIDSNGACPASVWESLAPVMDGAMIDLKCLDPEVHLRMTGHPNDLVLESIRLLHDRDRLHEVRLLLVPDVNDDPDLLRRTGEWLADVDPGMRVKLIGFRPHGVRPTEPPLVAATPDRVHAAHDLLAGIAPFEIETV